MSARRHDDAHFPLQGTGRRHRFSGGSSIVATVTDHAHVWRDVGYRCVKCGKEVFEHADKGTPAHTDAGAALRGE